MLRKNGKDSRHGSIIFFLMQPCYKTACSTHAYAQTHAEYKYNYTRYTLGYRQSHNAILHLVQPASFLGACPFRGDLAAPSEELDAAVARDVKMTTET